jgi:hypothetical protein
MKKQIYCFELENNCVVVAISLASEMRLNWHFILIMIIRGFMHTNTNCTYFENKLQNNSHSHCVVMLPLNVCFSLHLLQGHRYVCFAYLEEFSALQIHTQLCVCLIYCFFMQAVQLNCHNTTCIVWIFLNCEPNTKVSSSTIYFNCTFFTYYSCHYYLFIFVCYFRWSTFMQQHSTCMLFILP